MQKVFTQTRTCILTAVVLVLASFAGHAQQVVNYAFSQTAATYTPLSGGVVYGTSSSDDQKFVDPSIPAGGGANTGVGIPIGFNFVFNQDTFDRIAINNNGWISFGKSTLTPSVNMASTSSYYCLPSTAAITPALLRNRVAGLARDLQGRTGSTIKVETIGTAPNQVCVIEWSNYKRYGSGNTADTLNFQIRLNETSNVVDVVFGNMVFGTSTHTGNSNSPQIGLGGAVASDFNSRTTTTDWNSTTAATINTQGCDVASGVIYPANGTTMSWSPPPVCSGTPTAGTTNSSVLPVCSGVGFTLSLTGTTSGVDGLTFQWISSTDSINYSNVTGGTQATLLDTVTQATYFRCIVTCTASGLSDTSTVLNATLNTPSNCYCTPTYSSGCGAGDAITNVTLDTLNNTTVCSGVSPYFTYYDTLPVPDLQQTIIKNISISFGSDGSQYVGVWVDFNQDGDFSDADEFVAHSTTSAGSNGTVVLNFAVPLTATLGQTRMRVRGGNDSQLANTPCGTSSSSFGESEDYLVNITAAPPCTAPTGITVLAGDTFAVVTFTSTGLATMIEYGPAGFTPGTGTIDSAITSPYTIDSLSPLTAYTFYLQDTCTGSISPVSAAVNFTTACSPYPTPGNGLANAIPVTGLFFTDTVNTGSCYGNNSPLRSGNDVFYVIPGDSCVGGITVSLCGSSYDTYLYVMDSSNTTIIASNDDFCGLQSSVTFTPDAGSTYIVVVEPYGSGSGTLATTVTRTYLTPTVSHSFTSPSCQGVADGTASVTITNNPILPISYLWSTGATTDTIHNITSGTYTVTVTTACGTVADTITVSPAFNATVATTNVTCNGGDNGAVDVTVTNGTTPYSYLWSSGETTEDIDTLPAGTYTLTATEAGGCTVTLTAVVTEPTALSINGAVADVLCHSDSTGGVTLSVTGGAPLTNTLSQTATGSNLQATTTFTFTGLQASALAGSLTFSSVGDLDGNAGNLENWVFYDENGNQLTTVGGTGNGGDQCGPVLSSTVTVTPQQLATWLADGTATFTAVSSPNVNLTLCGNDFVAVDFSYPGVYAYVWSNGDSTSNLSNVVAGTYSVTVTDANGCTGAATYTINEPTAIAASLDSMFNVSCHGLSDGGVYVSVTGGVSPYTYSWSNAATTEDLMNVPAGTYTGTVTDANGCTLVSPQIPVTEPDALVITFDEVNDVSCNGNGDGGVNITVSGGTTPYVFAWSNAATTEDLTGVAGGNYSVAVTDSNGCSLSSSQVAVSEPDVLTLTADSVTDNTCFGASQGAIYVTAAGGTTPYSFAWSNGAATEDLMQAAAGGYSVSLTDANGCTVAAVSDTVAEPAQIIATTDTVIGVTCAGAADGGISISATGGTGMLSFAWSNADTTSQITGLNGGAYDVTVSDQNGCTVTLTNTVAEPDSLSPDLDALTNVACFGDSTGGVAISVAGGTPPYTFMWSNGSTNEDLSNVPAGNYTGTITDANGCVFTSPVVPVSEPSSALAATSVATNWTDVTVGAIDVTVTGGTSPYAFNWSTGESTEDISGLIAGVYSCTITDANGCNTVVRDTVDEELGIGENGETYTLNMYPNPTQSELTIKISLPSSNDVSVAIYSVDGRLVRTFNKVRILTGNFTVNFNNEAAGVYIAKIKVGESTTAHRIVVTR